MHVFTGDEMDTNYIGILPKGTITLGQIWLEQITVFSAYCISQWNRTIRRAHLSLTRLA